MTVSESVEEGNLFASASGDLRSCFLQTLGPEIFEEFVDGRQPTPEEGMKFGPCMDSPGSGSGDESTGDSGEGDATSQSADQPSNPFASASPELRNCIIQAVGQEVFEQLVGGVQPSQEDGARFGPCMGAQGSNAPGGVVSHRIAVPVFPKIRTDTGGRVETSSSASRPFNFSLGTSQFQTRPISRPLE